MKKIGFSLMLGCVLQISLAAQPASTNTIAPAASLPVTVLARSASSRVWARIASVTNEAGQVLLVTNKAYTELASGLCYEKDGQWVDSVEEIEVDNVAGGASARQAPHKVHFANIASQTDFTGATTSYQYVPNGAYGAGQVSRQTDANAKNTYYAYTALGKPYHIWGDVPYPSEMVYSEFGELTTTRTWDHGSRLRSIANVVNGAAVTSHSYNYDAINRRTRATLEDNSMWNYGVHDRNELTSSSRVWGDQSAVSGQQYGYAYDNIGNRQSASYGGDTQGRKPANDQLRRQQPQ